MEVTNIKAYGTDKEGLEQFCEPGATQTYNSSDKYLGTPTCGSYSESVVVDENFVMHIPKNLDLAATSPLLCAGITTYSPLSHRNVFSTLVIEQSVYLVLLTFSTMSDAAKANDTSPEVVLRDNWTSLETAK